MARAPPSAFSAQLPYTPARIADASSTTRAATFSGSRRIARGRGERGARTPTAAWSLGDARLAYFACAGAAVALLAGLVMPAALFSAFSWALVSDFSSAFDSAFGAAFLAFLAFL